MLFGQAVTTVTFKIDRIRRLWFKWAMVVSASQTSRHAAERQSYNYRYHTYDNKA